MRAYVAITPTELQGFVDDGFLTVPSALVVIATDLEVVDEAADDQEELEFEASWKAAQESKAKQDSTKPLGFVLAVDFEPDQSSQVEGDHVDLLSNISWPQVQSLLVSETEESELSWFAPQEISTYLPQWLA